MELLDKGRFINLVNELPFSQGYEIFKVKHFSFGDCNLNGEYVGRKQHCTFPITDNGDC